MVYGTFGLHNKIHARHQKLMYNAAWNTCSFPKSQFLWYDYALRALHYGAVKEYINTFVASAGVLVTINFFPAVNISISTYIFFKESKEILNLKLEKKM